SRLTPWTDHSFERSRIRVAICRTGDGFCFLFCSDVFQRPARACTRSSPARHCNHGANSNSCISAKRRGRAVGWFLFVTDQPLTKRPEKVAHFVLRSDALCQSPPVLYGLAGTNSVSLSSNDTRI